MSENFELYPLSVVELPQIVELAKEIWPSTYDAILSEEQISYMMDLMYAETTLRNQFEQGILFFIFKLNEKEIGYTAVEPNYKGEAQLYIHKLYFLPAVQSKGYGRKAIDAIINIGKQNNLNSISLNVNRHNKAKDFYLKLGFEVEKEEDIDIGNGYWMNDYVMRRNLIVND